MKTDDPQQLIEDQNKRISAIEGLLAILGTTSLDDDQRGYIEAIETNLSVCKEIQLALITSVGGARLKKSGGLSILLIDDDPVQHLFVKRALEDGGHSIVIASSGKQGFDLFVSSHFDMVLLDCQLPDLDGFQISVAIRKYEKKTNLPETPILAYTSHSVAGYKERCFKVGMNDYILKPISLKNLRQAVETAANFHRHEETSEN